MVALVEKAIICMEKKPLGKIQIHSARNDGARTSLSRRKRVKMQTSILERCIARLSDPPAFYVSAKLGEQVF